MIDRHCHSDWALTVIFSRKLFVSQHTVEEFTGKHLKGVYTGVLRFLLCTIAMELNDSLTSDSSTTTEFQSTQPSELERISPVLDLPPEIVSEIFTNFLPLYPECPPSFGIYSPMLLCRICRHWRAIALKCPVLWRAISIRIPWTQSDDTLARHLEVLKSWLARSGDCPLSFTLDFEGFSQNIMFPPRREFERFNQKSTFSPRFLQTVLLHCRRWEHVQICMHFQHLHLVQGDMPRLQSLTFGPRIFPSTDEQLHLFDQAPGLKRVTLTRYFLFSLYRLPWAQLTHLDGHYLYEIECAELLRDATNLVRCTFGICYSEDPEYSVIPAVPGHNHLRHLILRRGEGSIPQVDSSQLLDGLTLPALCSLEVYGPCITLRSLKEFVTRSHCILQELRVVDSSEEEEIYREAFPFIRDIIVELVVGDDAMTSEEEAGG
ncbi:hypothetical protein MVEN_02288800 [Mycena venus]|uniref:F-box domain-containing protein n=1 Tax=Mycena venus TaxID=2733690 RepID=A0A8H6X5G8_9AGAR|nr:hypothetical protein MVEN_02288800 [Mycena venus]